MMKAQLLKPVILLLLFAACKKDAPQPTPNQQSPQNSLTITINYEVDGLSLVFDTLLYTNAAGYNYSVITLQYFLSDISLIKQDSSKVKILAYHYTDATITAKNTFTIASIPLGNYIGICFNIGLDSLQNITGGLPDLSDNNNMEWPVMMGGGYHFMKFEGNFIDYNDSSKLFGFAMHLGNDSCLIKANPIYKSFTAGGSPVTLNLTMNLNEWFRNPYVYNFDTDGAFSMYSMMAMQKLAANGVDVFHYKN